MVVGRSADGLCKLVTLRGSCRREKERRRALLNIKTHKQRQSALYWKLQQPTHIYIFIYNPERNETVRHEGDDWCDIEWDMI